MRAIVYWPDRLFATRTETFADVTALRVQGAHGYSIRQGDGVAAGSSLDKCEIVLLPDDEEDVGQG